jgi:hypothetical protein
MYPHHRLLLCVFCLFNLVFLGCDAAPIEKDLTWTESGEVKTVYCNAYAQCQPYEVCVVDGWVECRRGRCMAIDSREVDLVCLAQVYSEHGFDGSSPPKNEPCGKDIDCLNGRICEDRICVDPPKTPSGTGGTSSGTGGSSSTGTGGSSVSQGGSSGSSSGSSGTGGTSSTPVSSVGICGAATPPPEVIAQMGQRDAAGCIYRTGPRPGDNEFRFMAEAVADTAGCRLEVLALTLYGVLSDGRSVAIAGTGAGFPAISWAGRYWRNRWYNPPDQLEKIGVPSSMTFTVPTDDFLIHLGGDGNNGNVSIAGFVDAYTVGQFRSSCADVKVRVGLDLYDTTHSTNAPSAESSLGSWVSCTSSSGVWTSSPRKNDLDCSGRIVNECRPTAETCNGYDDDCDGAPDDGLSCMSAPTPPPPPAPTPSPSNGCPSFGYRVTAGSALLNACSQGLQIKSWTSDGTTEVFSSPGQPLTVDQSWAGYAYVTTSCDGSQRDPSGSVGSTAAQAGFAQVCSAGQDITASTLVCNDGYSNKLAVALNPAEAGRCP